MLLAYFSSAARTSPPPEVVQWGSGWPGQGRPPWRRGAGHPLV